MKLKQIFIYTVIAGLFSSACAKMGSLTGGPKDEVPPRVMESKPENYSLQFKGKKIEITFDEFIQLNNINQELVVSPPLKEKPLVRMKNKTIIIELNDELRDSTTYTFNFGEAIKDNNEGNKLSNFEFVFSTGDYLDSLSVGGSVLNAFDLKPPDGPVGVMLYNVLDDSVVNREIPVYIGKTDANGGFRINNLRTGKYKLFALKDLNNNFLFDLPNEPLAFADSFLNVDPAFFLEVMRESTKATETDTIPLADSTNTVRVSKGAITDARADSASISADSSDTQKLIQIPDQLMVDLLLFTEENQSQFLNDNSRKERNRLEFNFSLPVSDSFSVRSLIPPKEGWFLEEVSARRDSFIYWILDPEVRSLDTIRMELSYTVRDSLGNPVMQKDSVYFVYREPAKSLKRKEESTPVEEKLSLSGLKNNAIIDLNAKIRFNSSTPIQYIDPDKIELLRVEDSLFHKEAFDISRDSLNSRIVRLSGKWQSKTGYLLNLYPGAMMDVFGSINDTLKYKFTTRASDYYGVLILNMDSLKVPALIQLMDLKDKLIKEHYMTGPGLYRFEYLKADKYRVKFILDENGNGRWDTGKYSEKRQPERIEYYKGDIEIRSNWDLEIRYR